MALPSALKLDVNEIEDFRKTLVSFHPEEISRLYKPNDKIRITFPKGLLDLSSFNLFFDARGSFYRVVNNGVNWYSLNYHFPKHTSSLIQSMRVFINNQEVSHITDYNTLYNIIYDIKHPDVENDGSDNKSPELKMLSTDGYNYHTPYNVGYSTRTAAPILSNGWFLYAAQPTEAMNESFTISEWIGFFQTIKYINTYNVDLQIEIELADPRIMFYQSVSNVNERRAAANVQVIDQADPDYTIWNVKANIHKIDFAGAPDIVNDKLTFTDYVSRKGPKTTVDKTQKLTMNVKANCINKLIGTFLRNDRDAVQGPYQSARSGNTIEYERLNNVASNTRLGTSYYFGRIGLGVKTVSFYIDDVPINNNPMSMLEIERELKHAFNIKKTIWKNVREFENDFFSAVMSLEDNVKVQDQIIKTGYNTQGRHVKVMFETEGFSVPANINFADEFVGQPVMFVEMERSIDLSNNNVKIF